MSQSGLKRLLSRTRNFFSAIRRLSEAQVHRTVLVSSSNNIYTNLALEDWFYKNRKFDTEEILLLWRNSPCVVIGRHQNPWLECNLKYLKENKISLARRNSGGGTVYHDMGNVNCTFFTTRKKYNRKNNLELICNSLNKLWNVDVRISKREDIILNEQYKISGTAAKLGNPSAYHHCTVLFNANKEMLVNSLDKENASIESNATSSVKTVVRNLKEDAKNIDYWPLVQALAQEFLGTKDGKWDIIEPNEIAYPGLTSIENGLKDWNWVFGHTPRFVIRKRFTITFDTTTLPQIQVQDSDIQREFVRELSTSTHSSFITLTLQVYHGKIESFFITPDNFLPQNLLNNFQTLLVDKLFQLESITSIFKSFQKATIDERIVFIFKCLQDMIKRA